MHGVTFWGIIFNASKTKTMVVYRSCTMYHQTPPLTIGGTVLKESHDLDILGMTFGSKMTFEKHLRSVSGAAYQIRGLRKYWPVFNVILLLHSLIKRLNRVVSDDSFLTGGVRECTSSICCSIMYAA